MLKTVSSAFVSQTYCAQHTLWYSRQCTEVLCGSIFCYRVIFD
jgi:hypothetical protein